MLTSQKISKKDATKYFSKLIVGLSTANLVGHIIANNIQPKTRAEYAAFVVGTLAIGGVVASSTESWTEDVVESLWATFEEYAADN